MSNPADDPIANRLPAYGSIVVGLDGVKKTNTVYEVFVNDEWVFAKNGVERMKEKKRAVTTRIDAFVRAGGIFAGEDGDGQLSALMQIGLDTHNARSAERDAKSLVQDIMMLNAIDCFFLHGEPTSPYSSMLKEIEEVITFGEPKGHVITFRPMHHLEVLGLFEFYKAPREKTFNLPPVSALQPTILPCGRAAGFSTLRKITGAVGKLHAARGKADPAQYFKIHDEMIVLSRDYKPNGAATFDMAVFLPLAFKGKDQAWTNPFECLRNWACLLFMIAIFARSSDVCEFCTLVGNMRLPENPKDFGRDGLPLFLFFTLHDSKTGVATEVRISRNLLNDDYCPVYWILKWLAVSGLKSGPLFPQIERTSRQDGRYRCRVFASMNRTEKHVKDHYAQTARRQRVNMTLDVQRLWFSKLCMAIGYESLLSLHSVRKSACKWAARCGATMIMMKNTGRWRPDSNEWHVYIEEGLVDAEFYQESRDPIRSIWVYRPTCVGAVAMPVL
jgi:hypothetical protein